MTDNYNDLTLSTFLEIDKILQTEQDEIDKQIDIISLLSGRERRDILSMPLTDYAALAAGTNFLRQTCPAATAPSRLIIGDLTLIPLKEFTQLTTAQYVDFQSFSKDGIQALPQLLSVLLIPEGHKYNEGYDIREVTAAVRSLSLPIALGLSAFFLNAFATSMQDSLTSSTETLSRMSREEKEQRKETLLQLRRMVLSLGSHA